MKLMLTNNKYERYQNNLTATMMANDGSSASSSPTTCASSLLAAQARNERESIHSGQFMVSHFEAEEAQDDLDDSEVKMLDPEDPSLSKADEQNTCTEVQLYVPRNVAQLQHQGYVNTGVGVITSHLEIETSLTKLFKCMNLAYSQKLTSPKWNHFKGVRLRWKDKIRLNNVIWRCWHMQFILKRRTPVCQFASPLDVDVHSNPQTVVLEGKYWKRQLAVIKAEYRKWRRHFKAKTTGCLTYDTRSEFDFLEWSPLNDRSLMISDDWTSDTLFSTIDGPFPFPDSREIARGAGIADFIQPSLGPLQPNIDDIDTSFAEFIQSTRLAPVPEEGADEMLKSVDYGFPAIMGAEQMDSSNIIDAMTTSTNNMNSMSNNDDANMLELNTPLNTLQYSEIEHQFNVRGNQNASTECISINNGTQLLLNTSSSMTERVGSIISTTAANSNSTRAQSKQYGGFASGSGSDTTMTGVRSTQQQQQANSNDFPGKSVIKGRVSKTFQRPRREPHNYDKAQPTQHQTTIYHQILAEQQKNQHHSSHHLQPINSFQQAQQLHFTQAQFPHQSSSGAPITTNLINKSNFGEGVNVNFASDLASSSLNNNLHGLSAGNGKMFAQQQQQQQRTSAMQLNVKIEPHTSSGDMISMFNLAAGSEIYGQSAGNSNTFISSNAYKPYPSKASFTKSSSTGTFNLRGIPYGQQQQHQDSGQLHQQLPGGTHSMHATQSLPLHLSGSAVNTHAHLAASSNASQTSHEQTQQQHQQQQQQQQQQLSSSQTQQQTQSTGGGGSNQILPKEMYRSNSLPLNVNLQSLETASFLNRLADNFAVPTYHAKNNKSRSRSNSMHQPLVPVSGNGNSNNNNVNGNTQNSLITPANQGSGASVICGNNLFMAPPQLQAATSDPMLNSTLAQLLTSNSRMIKHQSSSTSAISSSNPGPTSMPMTVGPRLSMSTTSAAISTPVSQQSPQALAVTTAVNSNIFMSPPLSSSSSSSLLGIASMSSSPTAQELLQHQNQQQHHLQQQRHHQSQQQNISMHTSMQKHQQHHHHNHPLNHQKQLPQPKSPKKSTSLPTPVPLGLLSSPPQIKTLSYPLTGSSQAAIATHLSLSPESFHDQDSPLSPTHSLKFPRDNQRRAGHIHAEQKRRYNIKNGFDLLHSLMPQLQQNPNAKLSKAAMLQKGADHIRHLCQERSGLKEKTEMLRQERDALNNSLTHLHSILPANGAPVTRQGTEHVRQLYEQYVRYRTMSDWKFWILGLILEPLLTSYTASVSSASMEEMRRTAFLWVDQHCSLIDLRPAVSNKLKYLSMKTDILSDPPSTLQEEVIKAVKNNHGQHPNLHGT